MALRARLAKIFETPGFRGRIVQRRIAARLCMGQGVAEIARLEGVPVARAEEIVAHPSIQELARIWMAFLARVRADRELQIFEEVAARLLGHELETGNGMVANFMAKMWILFGHPGRGFLQWAVRRFAALALRNMVRPPRTREAAFLPEPEPEEPLPEPSPAQLMARTQLRERLKRARGRGLGGGLDLRVLPKGWRAGVLQSLFLGLAANIEGRAIKLLPDGVPLPDPKPDPGPFPRPLDARSRFYVEPGTMAAYSPYEDWDPCPFPGAFPISPKGRVLEATVDLTCLYLKIAYRPWGPKPDHDTPGARRWFKAQALALARASPQAA